MGPFIFFDQMGPVEFPAGQGIDVRPHPHIGLATVTYLFEGEILHRDSLGFVQPIRPGEVNWMTAGRGIVHSERSARRSRRAPRRLHGIQSWFALPRARGEREPCFRHHPGRRAAVLRAGRRAASPDRGPRLRPRVSPSRCSPSSSILDAAMPAGARFALHAGLGERALYVADGELEIGGEVYPAGRLLLCSDDGDLPLAATRDARVLCFGGSPLDGERHIWWNFVSSRPERIERAKEDRRPEAVRPGARR